MRHGSSNRRTRGRGGSGGNNGSRGKAPNKNKVYDSSGPEVRIRGTAHQITEKYLVLAKDATSSGDHILAQSYMQHAEHYQRLINEWAEQNAPVATQQHEDDQEITDEDATVVAKQATQSNQTQEKVLEDA
tara:strand:+ start:41 stop:433 length:393 start_codon:yes stop_codon:yes gene_type:complete